MVKVSASDGETGVSNKATVDNVIEQKWEFRTGGSVWSSPALGDVDGDGKL